MVFALQLGAAHARAADEAPATAPVIVDGVTLFRVRGIQALPAEKRAASIAHNVLVAARNPQFPADSLSTRDTQLGTEIRAGDLRVMVVVDADAQVEDVSRDAFAHVCAARMSLAIRDYRRDRMSQAVSRSLALTGVATALLILVLLLIRLIWRRTTSVLESRFRKQVKTVGIGSFEVVRADRIWTMLISAIQSLRLAVVLAAAVFYVHYVLQQFPSTRAAANTVLAYVSGPLEKMGLGIYQSIPDLTFLVILVLIVRYVLKLVDLFFASVGRGEVTLTGFDLEWAAMTARLVKIGIIGLSIVVAYPYIPGSSSEAFKGVSVLGGVLFSLGASSTIANTVAGYVLIYRRVFKVGDRVRIGEVFGNVMHVRAQVTQIQTIKNEEVVIPNSAILNDKVINYSSLSRTTGLILHTTVGVGYSTPWRQVQAILLLAARRTEGLQTEPPPFVFLKKLDTFVVLYELNAYCADAAQMTRLYSDMHRNLVDAFNEHGVQIMTPAYEGDPERPKVVPPEDWYLAPAAPPTGSK